ncbi:MAG: hypothetical protein WC220_00670 [Pedobacter sp.]|jgi:hypothetical protein
MKNYSYLHKKFLLTGVLAVFILSTVTGQTSQDNWLVGGAGNFYFTEYKTENSTYNPFATTITLSPLIGYFVKNNFVIGMKPSFSYRRAPGSDNDFGSYMRSYTIGPLLRYYFLPPDKEFNLFAQGDFQYGVEYGGNEAQRGSVSQTSYSFLAGPVIFLNSSIGVEFTAGYSAFRNVKFGKSNEKFQLGIGFQIHLKKQ